MSDPQSCPFCDSSSLERLLQDVQISAKNNLDGHNVAHGIVAYRCRENGHIFFLCESDVDVPFLRN